MSCGTICCGRYAVPVASPGVVMSAFAPLAAISSSVDPITFTAVDLTVLLIVSPEASAAVMMVVPSIRPATISAVRARRRLTLRTPSLKKTRLRSANAARTTRTRASRIVSAVAKGAIGMPKNLSTIPPQTATSGVSAKRTS